MPKQPIFEGQAAQPIFVAFVDILGFGHRVKEDFDSILTLYDELIQSSELANAMREDVTVRVFSDAFLLTSKRLGSMIGVIQALHMQTLFHDCLIREASDTAGT